MRHEADLNRAIVVIEAAKNNVPEGLANTRRENHRMRECAGRTLRIVLVCPSWPQLGRLHKRRLPPR